MNCLKLQLFNKLRLYNVNQSINRHINNQSFVSEHFKVPENELNDVIRSMDTITRPSSKPNCIDIKECKLCPKGNKSKADNIWKLALRSNGSWYCFRCSVSGNWFDLKNRMNSHLQFSPIKSTGDLFNSEQNNDNNKNTKQIDIEKLLLLQDKYRSFNNILFPSNDKIDLNDDVVAVRKYLFEVRQLRKDILMSYGVGITYEQFLDDNNQWISKVCITFPWSTSYEEPNNSIEVINDNSSDITATAKVTKSLIQRVKCRSLETKGLQRLIPKGGGWGFFGWHVVKSHHKHIIITEGEYDAMAVAQCLSDIEDANHKLYDIPAISLPNGCSSLPVDLLPQLERFEKIYLWLDNDKSGIGNCEKMAKKLGLNRTYIVSPDASMKNPPKDANDALRQNSNIIIELLNNAKLFKHEKLQSFNDYKDEVMRLLRQSSKYEGTATPSLPKLTDICKGFRRGELVIFSGATGVGKTTLLSQLSIDFAKQGMPTLWGSFEIKNHRLLLKLLNQYYGNDISSLSDDMLLQLFSDFEQLPLKFMNFHGGSDIDQIIDVMDSAVYSHDIHHVIIDNLQFMTPRNYDSNMIKGTLERINIQDLMIDKFRKFATDKNVEKSIHLFILIIHPRKEIDNIDLSIASISGTAKATQEADMVLLLQKHNDNMFLDVKKNRFDGQLGKIELAYSKLTSSYYQKINQPNSVTKK